MAALMLSMSLATLVNAASVDPVYFGSWPSGNAEAECDEAGCTASFAYKIDSWDTVDPNGDHTWGGNTITISNAEMVPDNSKFEIFSFDWTSTYPVTCVIVSQGNIANVFYYPNGLTGDTNLYGPSPYAISHVTFCWNIPPPEIIVEKVIDWGVKESAYMNDIEFDFNILARFGSIDFQLSDKEQRTFTIPDDFDNPINPFGDYIISEQDVGWDTEIELFIDGVSQGARARRSITVTVEEGKTYRVVFVNMPPDFVIPETPWGVIGTMLTMLAAVALFSRKGLAIKL